MSEAKIEIKHDDHGLKAPHLDHMRETVKAQPPGFFVVVTELPKGCPDLRSALYGPAAGDFAILEDDVFYKVRNDRPGPSRLINRPDRPCRRMVVVGINGDDPVVFTAYGTQAEHPSPREWWDGAMRPHETIEAAEFWTEHALAAGEEG